jgi:hypothetical protein
MIVFIDAHKEGRSGGLRWGIEPICAVLPIAPSTYHAAKQRPPPARAIRDAELRPEILRVFEQNLCVDGADQVWAQLNDEGIRGYGCRSTAPAMTLSAATDLELAVEPLHRGVGGGVITAVVMTTRGQRGSPT